MHVKERIPQRRSGAEVDRKQVLCASAPPRENRKWILAVFAASLLAAGAGFGREAADFTGRYVWTTNAVELQAVSNEVDKTASGLFILFRPIARYRLAQSTAPYPFIEMVITNQEITFTRPGAPTIRGRLNGGKQPWECEEGEICDTAFQVTPDGALQQTLEQSSGARVNRFALSPDGRTLTLDVTISSTRLSRTIRYSLTYRREDTR
jgi:hypothetical protein